MLLAPHVAGWVFLAALAIMIVTLVMFSYFTRGLTDPSRRDRLSRKERRALRSSIRDRDPSDDSEPSLLMREYAHYIVLMGQRAIVVMLICELAFGLLPVVFWTIPIVSVVVIVLQALWTASAIFGTPALFRLLRASEALEVSSQIA